MAARMTKPKFTAELTQINFSGVWRGWLAGETSDGVWRKVELTRDEAAEWRNAKGDDRDVIAQRIIDTF